MIQERCGKNRNAPFYLGEVFVYGLKTRGILVKMKRDVSCVFLRERSIMGSD